ncbi:MAG: hypothetical protein PVJ09_00050 [Candidatus Woesebacteria bacterium]|jgi:hypothetical protein
MLDLDRRGLSEWLESIKPESAFLKYLVQQMNLLRILHEIRQELLSFDHCGPIIEQELRSLAEVIGIKLP